MLHPIIAPSLLSADFGRLNEEVAMLNQSEAAWYHIDVMDGVFVPNISFGFPVLKAIKKAAAEGKIMDVHLMIVQPERYVEEFIQAGAQVLTVHLEASTHLHRTLKHIKSLGAKAGVAINPHTPVSALEAIFDEIDLVCLMTVNPGFGGQSLIPNVYNKLQQLTEMRQRAGLSSLFEIDGGVTLDNAQSLVDAGADVLVAGNTVFSSANPSQTIQSLAALRQTSYNA
jgi:ribulose-phosphate 3-epimerase